MATNALVQPQARATWTNIGLWTIQIAVALMMVTAGWPKLAGEPMRVQLFEVIGFGQWFRYLTGGLEVIGAIGLLIPKLSGYAAVLISAIMLGAVLTHLLIIGGSPLIALVLLAGSLVVAWGRLRRR